MSTLLQVVLEQMDDKLREVVWAVGSCTASRDGISVLWYSAMQE